MSLQRQPIDPAAAPEQPEERDGAASLQRDVLIAGAGPAGLVLGLLLARAGLAVTVLEQHEDFLHDFRGDTVHPSTLQLLDELGFAELLAELRGHRIGNLSVPVTGGGGVLVAAFDELPPPYDFVALMPQAQLLGMLAEQAAQWPGFELVMGMKATGLMHEDGRVVGVTALPRSADAGGGSAVRGPAVRCRARLVVACDGRRSLLRASAGLVPRSWKVPFDVWWFRLPRLAEELELEPGIAPRIHDRDVMIRLTRPEYYQLGLLGPKGDDDRLRSAGLAEFRRRIAALEPAFAERLGQLQSLDEVHLLQVHLDRLRRWHRPGLLVLGDAAHAMSPVGGVGINLAIQDAVAAARLLAPELLAGRADGTVPSERSLARVRRRRLRATWVLQTGQRMMHRFLFGPILKGRADGMPRPMAALLRSVPLLRRFITRAIAYGVRREPLQ